MTERELIAFIAGLAKSPRRGLTVPIGDDCAVWKPKAGREIVVTTDQLVEGVHFIREGASGRIAGARLLGRGLSDLAAMGAEARLVFLNLSLPQDLVQRSARWTQGFVRGFVGAACHFGAHLAGGDISSIAGPMVASITAVGDLPSGTALLRSGARPGDLIYVTGTLGKRSSSIEPRLAVGQSLRRLKLATAAIDVSDGLSTDLAHLTEASRVGAVIEAAVVPHQGSLQDALTAGEDYELLFTASPQKKIARTIAGVAVQRIGRITRARTMRLQFGQKYEQLRATGWEHFRPAPRDRRETR